MYGCENWTIKKAECQRIDAFWLVLEKMLESPLDCQEIKWFNPKGNQPWIFIGRTDAEAEAPILWPLGVKSQLTRKDSDGGKDWGQEEKGAIEDEMVRWYRWFSGLEFEQTLGDGEGKGGLVYCSPWSCRVWRDLATEWQQQLNSYPEFIDLSMPYFRADKMLRM